MRTTSASAVPAAAFMVSAAWLATVSSLSTAAAMPPCAQQLAQMPPSGFSLSTITRCGARLRAANNPAAPAPTMTTSALFLISVFMLHLYRQHFFHRQFRPRRNQGIDSHLMRHGLQAGKDVFQRNPLHVRAEVAGPHELDARIVDRDV